MHLDFFQGSTLGFRQQEVHHDEAVGLKLRLMAEGIEYDPDSPQNRYDAVKDCRTWHRQPALEIVVSFGGNERHDVAECRCDSDAEGSGSVNRD